MARIRSIKPEFPQSESMGRVSRDARLLFIELWTLCDDEGRLRGNSRMLASLLFPYDDDAPDLIDRWIFELERESCIVRYIAEGSTYIQICNWLNHQKIDKPSKSKIPPFDESSRIFANPLERSSEDQGSRIKDQGSRIKDQGEEGIVAVSEPTAAAETDLQVACRETWASYKSAYQKRYSVDPIRNAKVNAQVKQFVQRIGREESPHVACFYLSHENAFYVKKGHDLGSLVADAEKLRTEWATNRMITSTSAQQADRTQSNLNAAQEAISMLQAEGVV